MATKAERLIFRERAKIEDRLARAFVRSTAKLRSRISVSRLARSLASRRPITSAGLVSSARLRDVLAPSVAIIQDGVTLGGKIAARIIRAEV